MSPSNSSISKTIASPFRRVYNHYSSSSPKPINKAQVVDPELKGECCICRKPLEVYLKSQQALYCLDSDPGRTACRECYFR